MPPEEYDKLTRSDCFVCRIAAGRPLVPNVRVVYEDDSLVVFLDQFPSQEGYTLVAPKKHVERFEDMAGSDWVHLMEVVQRTAQAVSETSGAIRMYLASLGSPERNAHVHIHVCPCPPGTPLEQQQFAAMDLGEGKSIQITEAHMDELAEGIRSRLAAESGV